MSFDRHLVNFVVIEEFLALSRVVMLDLLDLMTFGGIFGSVKPGFGTIKGLGALLKGWGLYSLIPGEFEPLRI